MAQDRLSLQMLLESIIGVGKVYFQPPPNLQMQFPCIIYNRDSADEKYANNYLYQHKQKYQVTVVDRNPDSPIPMQIAYLPLCRYDRFFTADNLNHDVFTLFF